MQTALDRIETVMYQVAMTPEGQKEREFMLRHRRPEVYQKKGATVRAGRMVAQDCFYAVSSIGTTRVIVPMQPSESAVTICKIMVGLRVQPEETSARNDVQSAFLGLGSERTPEEFSDGVTYAVAQEWVIEVNGDTLKISRTGFVVGSS